MNLALSVNVWNDEDLLFAEQFGVTHILALPVAPAGRTWDAALLAAARNRAEKAGFRFVGLDGLPSPLDAVLRQAAREEAREETREAAGGRDAGLGALDAVDAFITFAGAAGVPLIRYDLSGWAAGQARSPEGRARALARRFVAPAPDSVVSDSLRWERAVAVLQRIVLAAERAGVKLACRPGPRYNTARAWRQLIDAAPSAAHGLDFSHGDVLRMPGIDLSDTIRQFGRQGKIFLAEAANCRLDAGGAVEAFVDEPAPRPADAAQPGATLMRSLQAYREIGFDGAIRPAPPPGIAGDTAWGHIGQALSTGYLRAWLQVVERAADA
jgi:D-mannonate dehydratase